MHLPSGFLELNVPGLYEVRPVNFIKNNILPPISSTPEVIHVPRRINAKLADHHGTLAAAVSYAIIKNRSQTDTGLPARQRN